jgi:hypothetical protein
MPICAKNEPIIPALVDADAAIVRVIFVRHRDVAPSAPIEPKPRSGEQRVAGVVEALPQDPRGVGLVLHHQVAVVEENCDGGDRRGGAPRHRRLPKASPGLLDVHAAAKDLKGRAGQVGDDDPAPNPELGAGAWHLLELDAEEVVDSRAGGEEPKLEHTIVGYQRLVPGDALVGEDGASID